MKNSGAQSGNRDKVKIRVIALVNSLLIILNRGKKNQQNKTNKMNNVLLISIAGTFPFYILISQMLGKNRLYIIGVVFFPSRF